ncbi:MAG: alpha/beta fold hydrolase [Methylococcaceae bacterium]|nr:alpha/beta fold hydrolase [Methylococcaceae bacterium]
MNKRLLNGGFSWFVLGIWLFSPLASPVYAKDNQAVISPDQPGPYTIGHITKTVIDHSRADRAIPVDIWYPAHSKIASKGSPAIYSITIPTIVDSTNITLADRPYTFLQFNAPLTQDEKLQPAYENVPAVPGKRFPLIIVSHGFGASSFLMSKISLALASHGFIVVAPNHPGSTILDGSADIPHALALYAQDVPFVIDQMLVQNKSGRDSDNPLRGHINTGKIAVLGHSLGGFAAYSGASGYANADLKITVPADRRIKAIVPVEGAYWGLTTQELSRIKIPALLIGVADIHYGDTTGSGIGNGNSVPWGLLNGYPKYRVDVKKTLHSSFVSLCPYAKFLENDVDVTPITAMYISSQYDDYCSSYQKNGFPYLPDPQAERIAILYSVAFLKQQLQSDAKYGRYLTTAYAQQNQPDVIFYEKRRKAASDNLSQSLAGDDSDLSVDSLDHAQPDVKFKAPKQIPVTGLDLSGVK